ncbi:MAG TPA: glycosyltransferase family 4 protein [Candidatus Angelobacter sp.]|nr:glycosyltransferase family 4 protein [Candidatus Angelobacter sp.]
MNAQAQRNTTTGLRADASAAALPPRPQSRPRRRIRVLLMDLWCFIPYYMTELTKGLEAENIQADLLSTTYRFEPKFFRQNEVVNNPGLLDVISKIRIPWAKLRQLLKLLEYCCNLTILVITLPFTRPEILHVQYLALLSRGLPLELPLLYEAKALGIKLVCTVHNLLPHDTGDRHRGVFQRLYRMADLIICHNRATRERLIREFGVLPEVVEVIPHGPLQQLQRNVTAEKARESLGLPHGIPIVLWQGVIVPYKGIDFLLEAWGKVTSKAYLLIAGTGDEKLLAALRDKAAALETESTNPIRLDLRFIPPEELPNYFQAADILVYPYKQITTSGALMTGLGYGKAIIVSKLPTFEEMLTEGKNALMVEYGDANAFADSLNALLENPALRTRLGMEAKALEQSKYSWKQIASKTRDCYDTLLLPGQADC